MASSATSARGNLSGRSENDSERHPIAQSSSGGPVTMWGRDLLPFTEPQEGCGMFIAYLWGIDP
jgi:hypothetical protein